MSEPLSKRYAEAERVAREAGVIARRYFEHRHDLVVEHKGIQDLVSAADREVERFIIESLKASFPSDQFLGEEGGGTEGRSLWVIDPIDGTTNFLRGLPVFCVSIAYLEDGVLEIGVIYDPTRDEMFTARRGRGALLNGQVIEASDTRELSKAVVGLGYSRREGNDRFVHTVRALLLAQGEFRRFGSAALGIAYVAAGRLDAFMEYHLNSWDTLAGLLLVEEAGAYANHFLEGEALLRGNAVLVSCRGLVEVLTGLTGIR